MRWKWVKWICIQQFLQLIQLDCLWSFLWTLSLRTDQNSQLIHLQFGHVHQVIERLQLHICLLKQGQVPLHICGVTRSGCLLQRREILPSISTPVWPIFSNLVGLVAHEHVCPHVFACVTPPLFQLLFSFIIFGVLLKYPLPTRMFRQKSRCVTPTGGD